MGFKDHFSEVASSYAIHRPEYPSRLFAWLASLSQRHDLAWDCACGSGQASRPLASHFDLVVASDASSVQVATARPSDNVHYIVASAEPSPLTDGIVDLITVAQALHWFVGDAFYAEVRRLLRPRGVFAAWTYGLPRMVSPAVERSVHRFIDDPLGPHWPPEIRLVLDGYTSLEFPFKEIDPPAFEMNAEWTLAQFLGHVRTWSATQKFIEKHGEDPVDRLAAEVEHHWAAEGDTLPVSWRLKLRVGRKP
jgi:SAM-dependent methyltransferase